MAISEPTTMITDYALAALAAVLAGSLLRRGALLRSKATSYWGLAFVVLAIGAAAGGTAHGFAATLDQAALGRIWKLTLYSIGFASLFMLLGSARSALSRGASRRVALLAWLKLAVYLYWMSGHDEFRWVIFDYAPSMLAVAGLSVYQSRVRRRPGGKWIAAGVAVSFAAAAVQQSGFALHRHFNHNDLYHLIQMAGLVCFFRGARKLRDR